MHGDSREAGTVDPSGKLPNSLLCGNFLNTFGPEND